MTPCLTPARLECLADQDFAERLDSGDHPRDDEGESHLAQCATCRAAIDWIRTNREFVAQIAAPLRAAVRRPPPRVPGAECALLPGYRQLDVLGHGGQAVVHRAVHEASGRIVAVKVLRFGSLRQRARMAREAQLAATLRHPGIVTLHDCGELPEGGFAIVMELVDGVPLDAWSIAARGAAKATTMSRRQRTARVFVRLCDAVAHAHQNGVIHRDLKPTNVLVGRDDTPRVLDFGVAHSTHAGRASVITRTDEFSGTFAYAAPETLSNSSSPASTLADVYAIGVMLHEAMVGRPLHQVDGAVESIIRAIVEVEPARPTIDVDGAAIDTDLSVIIVTAVAKDPARRYDSAAALGRDLDNWIAGRPIEARRDSLSYILRTYVRRHRPSFAVAATLLVALVAGLILSLTFWRQAVTARTDLERALERTKASEQETQRVAAAQAKLFDQLDPQTMGVRLREDVLVEARAALERAGVDGGELTARLTQLDALLAGTNFTNAGARNIDRNALTPALESIERDLNGQPLVQAALWTSIAGVYAILGRHDSAIPLAKRSLETRRRILGNDHPDTLDSMLQVGDALNTLEKREEAAVYYREAMDGHRRALDQRRRELGDDHLETLSAIAEMASTLWAQGNAAEAEPYAREVMDRRRRVQGDDHPDTLVEINLLGTVLMAQSKFAEAEQYYLEALERRQRVLGDDDAMTRLSVSNMGLLLKREGRWEEAERYSRQALEDARRLGDERGMRLQRIFLPRILQGQRRWAEAEPLQRDLLEQYRVELGDNHPTTLIQMSIVGSLIVLQGRCEEAEPFCRSALEGCRRVLGNDHSYTLAALFNMTKCMRCAGQLDTADELGAEAVSRARGAASTPASTGMLGGCLLEHGKTLAAMERFEQAEAELLEALTFMEPATSALNIKQATTALAELHEAWCVAEPDQGHDDDAAVWRAKLDALEASTRAPVEPKP